MCKIVFYLSSFNRRGEQTNQTEGAVVPAVFGQGGVTLS